jgi:hypothetical protein
MGAFEDRDLETGIAQKHGGGQPADRASHHEDLKIAHGANIPESVDTVRPGTVYVQIVWCRIGRASELLERWMSP